MWTLPLIRLMKSLVISPDAFFCDCPKATTNMSSSHWIVKRWEIIRSVLSLYYFACVRNTRSERLEVDKLYTTEGVSVAWTPLAARKWYQFNELRWPSPGMAPCHSTSCPCCQPVSPSTWRMTKNLTDLFLDGLQCSWLLLPSFCRFDWHCFQILTENINLSKTSLPMWIKWLFRAQRWPSPQS